MTELKGIFQGPTLFHSTIPDVVCYTNAYTRQILLILNKQYSRYFALFLLPAIGGKRVLGQSPYGELFLIEAHAFSLVYKIIYLLRAICYNELHLQARNNQYSYVHSIDMIESLTLSVVAQVEHEMWGDVIEGRVVRKYHLDRALEAWLYHGPAGYVPKINIFLDRMISRAMTGVEKFLDHHITRKAEYLAVMRDYLRMRDRYPGFQRGDLIRINRGTVLIYDGKYINNMLNVNQNPMYAITEFPLHYWSPLNMVQINANEFYIKDGTFKDPRLSLRGLHVSAGIALSPNIEIATFNFTHEGKSYVFLVSYDAQDHPTPNDLRNWLLVSRRMWIPTINEHFKQDLNADNQNIICTNSFHPQILQALLMPLRIQQHLRVKTILKCDLFPPELGFVIAHYAQDHF